MTDTDGWDNRVDVGPTPLMSVGMARSTKIFSRFVLAVLVTFLGVAVYEWLSGDIKTLTVFYGIIGTVVVLVACIDEERFRLILYDDCIVRLGVLRRRIPYIAVVRVVVNPNKSVIESADARIAVNRGVDKRNQLMCEIIQHIQSKSGAEIVGDVETISKYKSGVI